jgi:hypothetical protein
LELNPKDNSITARALGGWSMSPIAEVGSGHRVNILLGVNNNLDQFSGSDRPDMVPAETPGAVLTRYGWFASPPPGCSDILGRNAIVGPGYASVSCRMEGWFDLGGCSHAEFFAKGFNLFNPCQRSGREPGLPPGRRAVVGS